MPTKDQSWFERKVQALGDALRRLPRSRRRALTQTIEREQRSLPYPMRLERLVVATRPPKPGEGTFTPAPPYGVESEAGHGRARQLDTDEGESESNE